MGRVSRESPSTRASSFSPRETYSATYFLPLTKRPHLFPVRPFIYQGRQVRKLLMLQSPCVCRRSSAVAENYASLGQGHPLQTALWPCAVRPTGSGKVGRSHASCFESPAWPPVMTEADRNLRATLAAIPKKTSAATEENPRRHLKRTATTDIIGMARGSSARCEPVPAFLLLPGPPTCPAWPSAASASTRCEPILAFPLLPGPSTCPAWPSSASASARCEPFPTNRLTPASRD